MLAEARVGTSGFAHREWIGSVYPRGAAPSQLLGLYAQRLSTVEISSTFTRQPSPEQLAGWVSAVPPVFQFALKAPSRVTQDLRLGNAGARALLSFLEGVADLGEHLGPLLVQVPESYPPDRRALAEFLRQLPSGIRVAMELRHPSWHEAATLRMLSAHNVALVLSDSIGSAPRLELTADFAYVRIRRDDDAPDAWAEWAERLATLTRRGVDVYAFLKHDRRGLAVDRAMRLSSLLRSRYDSVEHALLS